MQWCFPFNLEFGMFNKPITPLFRYGLIACLLIVGNVARAADINREFEAIANSLAVKIAATNKTKIAVADLTDLPAILNVADVGCTVRINWS